MSYVYRVAGCYTQHDRAIYYTDTDSMVLPSICIPPLLDAGLIGSNIGQLGCDLHDPFVNQQFGKIVRGVWAAPKGPYSLVYLLPNQTVLKEKIRTKGIPHPDGPFVYEEDIMLQLSDEQQDRVLRSSRWLVDRDGKEVPSDMINKRYYLFEIKDTNVVIYASHINFAIIKAMMEKEGTLTCYFGGMDKAILSHKNVFLSIAPTVNSRTPCNTDWWTDGNRFYACELDDSHDTPSPYDLTYPKGFGPAFLPRDVAM